jgi:hypothetical protein
VAECGALDVIVINAGALVMGDPLTLDPDAVDRCSTSMSGRPITPRSKRRGA